MAKFGKFVLNVLLTALCVVAEIFTMFYLYKWFLFPIIGVEITPLHCYGLMMAVNFLVGKNNSDKQNKELWEIALYNSVYNMCIFGIGAFVNMLMK